MNYENYIKIASEIKRKAYAPYSKFKVGALVVTDTGKLYTGVNIENVSYGASNCAERTAVFKAVSEEECSIKTVVIASDSEDYIFPCGICRQVLVEFCSKNTEIVCSKKNGEYVVYTMEELMPEAFTRFST